MIRYKRNKRVLKKVVDQNLENETNDQEYISNTNSSDKDIHSNEDSDFDNIRENSFN